MVKLVLEWFDTEVLFELVEENGKTKVTLVPNGWQELTEFYRLCNFNRSFFHFSSKNIAKMEKEFCFRNGNFKQLSLITT
ncbi:hypothetical protein DYD21_06715 [Rhodohalobacter sp. SW132]|nr:hypothetical protein DYD21_06715 [Rhodohalobacter sp. SW132]